MQLGWKVLNTNYVIECSGVFLPFCPHCGSEKQPDDRYCKNCGKSVQPTSELQVGIRPGTKFVRIETISGLDIWKPIIFLFLIVFMNLLHGALGLIALVAVTVWVHYNSKKFAALGGSQIDSRVLTALTLLLAIVGLPLYSYRLHELRKTKGERWEATA